MQDGFFATDNQGMTGIMTTLKTHNMGGFFCEQIHDLALAFVTPLCAENYYIFTHDLSVTSSCCPARGFNFLFIFSF
jgi:hypothetical protein